MVKCDCAVARHKLARRGTGLDAAEYVVQCLDRGLSLDTAAAAWIGKSSVGLEPTHECLVAVAFGVSRGN